MSNLIKQVFPATLFTNPESIPLGTNKAILKINPDNRLLELEADFMRKLNKEFSDRFTLIKFGMEEPTATDQLLTMLYGQGELRFLD